MQKTKVIVITSIVGAILAFCFWPVLSGLEILSDCRDNPVADCPSAEKISPRITYILNGQRFDNSGFASRSQYCDIAESCKSELVYVPLSLLIGAIGGAVAGLVYTRIKRS
jgi:hypothetical protein